MYKTDLALTLIEHLPFSFRASDTREANNSNTFFMTAFGIVPNLPGLAYKSNNQYKRYIHSSHLHTCKHHSDNTIYISIPSYYNTTTILIYFMNEQHTYHIEGIQGTIAFHFWFKEELFRTMI